VNERPTTLRPRGSAPLLLTCEHASFALPERYAGLGLDAEQLRDHIGWDIGAAAVVEKLSDGLAVPAVLSAVSRLLVDCNRDECAEDLMPQQSHGIVVPGNQNIDAEERETRLRQHYEPFHDAVDRRLYESGAWLLLSVHSFTPVLNGSERGFDIGVLFDDHAETAEQLAELLRRGGMSVRMNEPYSGLEGLIFSANRHGRRHSRRYVEIEINNRLLRNPADINRLSRLIERAVAALLAGWDGGRGPNGAGER
jgi:predicted N-formylglutamate amidohydrolase